jgi:hypothetical protein
MSTRNWETLKKYTDIKFEFFEGIGKITINRPHVYNAFRPETNFEMLDAMNICRENPDINVVVLTGEGDKAFCSGGDQNVKGVGGYISENGVPRLNVLDLHKVYYCIGDKFQVLDLKDQQKSHMKIYELSYFYHILLNMHTQFYVAYLSKSNNLFLNQFHIYDEILLTGLLF